MIHDGPAYGYSYQSTALLRLALSHFNPGRNEAVAQG